MAILKNKKKNILITGVIVLPILLSTSAANAKPLPTITNEEPPSITSPTETIPDTTVTTTKDGETFIIIGHGAQALADEINPPPPPAPEPVYVAPVSNATFAQTAAPIPAAPASAVGSTLLEAARSQLGQAQDCTSMVERALRAIGIAIGDVGPMGFAGVGVQVSADDAQPGDIMMRSGHVAIYAGNGVAVHGGFGGSTVESASDGNPHAYAMIVRV